MSNARPHDQNEAPKLDDDTAMEIENPAGEDSTGQTEDIIAISSKDRPPEKSKICYLTTKLPFELLDHILSFTPSPRDVLALARTNKAFCNTLVDNDHAYIWRRARARCKPAPIPDPTPNFTEPAYAAFLFDYGKCEVCNASSKKMYSSFNLRARFCEKPDCRKTWREQYTFKLDDIQAPYTPIARWIPRLEPAEFDLLEGYWTKLCRKSDFEEAKREFDRATRTDDEVGPYMDAKEILVRRQPTIVKFCKALSVWRKSREDRQESVKKINAAITNEVASKAGWTPWLLQRSDIYSTMYRTKDKCLEQITLRDIEFIRPQFEAQILHIQSRDERRELEKAYRTRREDIEKHYLKLKTKSQHDRQAFPSLSTFRKLPILDMMQKISTPNLRITKELNQSAIAALVNITLKGWREEARDNLSVILGCPNWKSANQSRLHPTERATARFRCKRCNERAKGVWKDGGLDFIQACEHECPDLKGKHKSSRPWSADQFEADLQAIAAVKEVFRQLYVNEESSASLVILRSSVNRIVCVSCDLPIVMDFSTMLRHCKRHTSMELLVVSADEAKKRSAGAEVKYGLAQQLMSGLESERQKKEFFCRHCPPLPAGPEPEPEQPPQSKKRAREEDEEDANADSSRDSEPAQKKRRVKCNSNGPYAFDGLRSHAKTKHTIAWIGDEDFYCRTEAGETQK